MRDFSDDPESTIGLMSSDVSSSSSSISSPDISYSSSNSPTSSFIASLISTSPPSSSSRNLSSTSTYLDTARAYNARRRLAIEETEYLVRQFHKKPKPTTKEQREIADHLNLQPRTVQVWFQNRRAKLKRDDMLARDLILDEEEEEVNAEECEEEFKEEMSGEEGDGHGSKVESQGRTNNKGDHMVSMQTYEQPTTVEDSKDRLGTGGETFLGLESADTVSDWMQLFESAGFQISSSLSSDEGSFTPLTQDVLVGKESALPSMDCFGNATFYMGFGVSGYDIDSGSEPLVSDQDVSKEGIDSTLLPSCRIVAVNGQAVGRDVQNSVVEVKTSITKSTRKRHRSTSHSKAVVTSLGAHANRCPGDRNGDPSSSSRARRVPVLRRRHNPIPRQQMAFTLIADS
ncbi:hypothetical protein BG011_000013 [Mortierella polycephala]|uniref:Homeobox domain-containing protein n=1 Tax=Mortierella polycephala TaxID=41804 RepID=A0A9P6UBD0_9FUNG|nr:hypothetical protein BG011_000013 [Mortierella polycephala]